MSIMLVCLAVGIPMFLTGLWLGTMFRRKAAMGTIRVACALGAVCGLAEAAQELVCI